MKFTSLIIVHDVAAPSGLRFSHYRDFTIKRRHTTLDRTPLDE